MAGKNTSAAIKVALFLAGVLVLALGLILLMPRLPLGTSIFIAVDAIMLYALVLGPILFNDALADVTGGKVISLTIYLKAVAVYAALTIGVIYVLLTVPMPPISFLVVLQLAGLVGLGFVTFLSLSVSQQVEAVAQAEAGVRASVDRLRATSQRLATQASYIQVQSAQERELVNGIQRIADELRYLSPVHSPEAFTLESQIASYLDTLLVRVQDGMTPADVSAALQDVRGALAVIDQRKNLRS